MSTCLEKGMTGVHDINTQPFTTTQTKVQDREKVETNTRSNYGGLWSINRWQIYSTTWRGRNRKEYAFGGPDQHNVPLHILLEPSLWLEDNYLK